MAASKVQIAARLQQLARVDERLPRLPDGRRHRGHLLAMRLGEFPEAADRFGELPTPAGDVGGRFLFGSRRWRKWDGRAQFRPLARVTAAAEGGDITAARHLDDQGIVAADAGIVTRQRLTHAHGLDAHDGIRLRIKIGAATERFHRNRIGFELAAVTGQRRFDDEGQKAGQPIGVAERAAADDPAELAADVVGVQPLRNYASGVAVSAVSFVHRPQGSLNRRGGLSS